jgi:hypothetical protein
MKLTTITLMKYLNSQNGKAIRSWGTATAKQLEDVNATR